MSFVINMFRGRSPDEASTSHEIIPAHTTRTVRLDPTRPLDPPTQEELNQKPHRIFIASRKIVFLERIVNPSLMEVPRYRMTNPPQERKDQPRMDVDDSNAAYTYRWDFTDWNRIYNIPEVCIWDLGSWVDDDRREMVLGQPPDDSSLTHIYRFGQLTPPNRQELEKEAEYKKEREAERRHQEWLNRDPLVQWGVMTNKRFELLREQSGGRLERLVKALEVVNYNTLILADHALWSNRQTLMIFYLIKIMGDKVRNLTLDNIRAVKPINLVDNLQMESLDSLTLIQTESQPAWRPESVVPLLSEWLRIDPTKKRTMSFFFAGINFAPWDVTQFIQEWAATDVPHLFGKIVFEFLTFNTDKLVAELERDWADSPYTHPTRDRWRYRDPDRYVIPTLRKQIIFPHPRGSAKIHYSCMEGRHIFRCFPNEIIMLKNVLSAHHWRDYIESGGDREGRHPGYNQNMVIFRLRPPPIPETRTNRMLKFLKLK